MALAVMATMGVSATGPCRRRIFFRRVDAAHIRHLHVHQDDIVLFFRRHHQRLNTVIRDVDPVAAFRQHRDRDLLIDQIVLGEKNVQARRSGRRNLARCACLFAVGVFRMPVRVDRRKQPGRPCRLGGEILYIGVRAFRGLAGKTAIDEKNYLRIGVGLGLRVFGAGNRPARAVYVLVDQDGIEGRGSGARRVVDEAANFRNRGHFKAEGLQLPGDDFAALVVLVGQQHVRAGRCGRGLIYAFLKAVEIEFDPERAADAFLAVDADFAAHQFDDLFADGKTQPRAAKPPGRRHIRLNELLEQPGLRFRA
jgi:hypothetical protein